MREEKVSLKFEKILSMEKDISELIAEKKMFPMEVNIAIAKNAMELKKQTECFKEEIQKLLDRFALKGEDGMPKVKNNEYVFETLEEQEGYAEAVKELADTEISILLHKIAVDGWSRGEKYDQPTAHDLIAMDFMLE